MHSLGQRAFILLIFILALIFIYLFLKFVFPVLPASVLTFTTGAHTTYCNMINVNRSFYYAHLNPSAPAGRSALKGLTVRVTGFEAKSVKNSDVNNVFTAAGLEPSSAEIMWVDGESFYVNFPKHFLVEVSSFFSLNLCFIIFVLFCSLENLRSLQGFLSFSNY